MPPSAFAFRAGDAQGGSFCRKRNKASDSQHDCMRPAGAAVPALQGHLIDYDFGRAQLTRMKDFPGQPAL